MTDSSSQCIFCDIASGKAPADHVYHDDAVVAFWDSNPARPIHILIVPREHIATLNDVPAGSPILGQLGEAAKIIAEKFGVSESGYRFFINVNSGGGQVIFHLHAHVVANKPG
jgi:histidine triad (HIT) family protein